MVGGCNDDVVDDACGHLVELGITPIVYNNSDETEAAKLLSTSYYGWNIKYLNMVHDFCITHDLDFDNVYESTNHNYNEGYDKLRMPNVRRPVLKYINGGIGGHCVFENATFLTEYPELKSLSTEILSLGKDKYKKMDYTDRNWLATKYFGEKLSVEEIARQSHASQKKILEALKKHGFENDTV